MIKKEVLDMINESAEKCGILSYQSEHYAEHHGSNWYLSPSSYKFNWIDYSPNDRTKLSGMANNLNCAYPPDIDKRTEKGTYLKPAKLISSMFPDICQDTVNLIGQKVAWTLRQRNSFDLSVLKIHKYPSIIYCKKSHFPSCMKSQNKGFFELYDELENCNILFLLNEDNECIGRSLLWNDVQPDNIKLMDRIYFNNEDTLALFVAYAKANGYYHKKNQRLFETQFINPETEKSETMDLWINTPDLIDMELEYIPYMDTFYKYDSREFILSNSGREDTTLTNTNGTDTSYILTEPKEKCCNCNAVIDEDNAYYQDESCYCEECYNDLFIYCECCQDVNYHENVTYVDSISEYVCDYHLNRNFTRCYECGDYFPDNDNDMVTDNRTDNTYCQHCAERYLSYCSHCETCTSSTMYDDNDNHNESICIDCVNLCENCDHTGSEDLIDGLCENCYDEKIEQEEQEEILFRQFDIAA